MAVITSGSAPKALWEGIQAWWGRDYSEHGMECRELFDIDDSSKAYEEDVEITGFGLAAVKNEGTGVSYDTESQGTVTRFTHVAYGLGFQVTREEFSDNLYTEVGEKRTQALAFSMRTTKEIVSANVYNRAFNSAYVFGDGVELLSTAHPVAAGGTQSNKLAVDADLSEAMLEDLCILIDKAQNSRGLEIAIKANSLIIPTGNKFEAHRILESLGQSGTANNDANALKDMGLFPGGVHVNHYLTDQDATFIRTDVPRGMIMYNREAIDISNDGDFDTDNFKVKAYERYSPGASDFRGLYGTAGA